jgi:hypothetical protein
MSVMLNFSLGEGHVCDFPQRSSPALSRLIVF